LGNVRRRYPAVGCGFDGLTPNVGAVFGRDSGQGAGLGFVRGSVANWQQIAYNLSRFNQAMCAASAHPPPIPTVRLERAVAFTVQPLIADRQERRPHFVERLQASLDLRFVRREQRHFISH
jgi:hypothetical protein